MISVSFENVLKLAHFKALTWALIKRIKQYKFISDIVVITLKAINSIFFIWFFLIELYYK